MDIWKAKKAVKRFRITHMAKVVLKGITTKEDFKVAQILKEVITKVEIIIKAIFY